MGTNAKLSKFKKRGQASKWALMQKFQAELQNGHQCKIVKI
jgi:hypothetical protein